MNTQGVLLQIKCGAKLGDDLLKALTLAFAGVHRQCPEHGQVGVGTAKGQHKRFLGGLGNQVLYPGRDQQALTGV